MKKCLVCSSPFEPRNSVQKMCSKTCSKKRQVEQTVRSQNKDPAKRRAYLKEWRGRVKGRHRKYHLKHQYGVTLEQVETQAVKQGHRCAICQEKKPLCVDHDHENGHFRGLLCRTCNSALGLFGEDPRVIERAMLYAMVR